MQGHWERRQIRQAVTGTLLFTREQAKFIQTETQVRMKLHSARLRERAVGAFAGIACGRAVTTPEAASPL
jgi:hypothetical protein